MKIIDRVRNLEMRIDGVTVSWIDHGTGFATMSAQSVMRTTRESFPDAFIAGVRCSDRKTVTRFLHKYKASMSALFEDMRVRAAEECEDVVLNQRMSQIRIAVSSAIGVVSDDVILDIVHEELARHVHET